VLIVLSEPERSQQAVRLQLVRLRGRLRRAAQTRDHHAQAHGPTYQRHSHHPENPLGRKTIRAELEAAKGLGVKFHRAILFQGRAAEVPQGFLFEQGRPFSRPFEDIETRGIPLGQGHKFGADLLPRLQGNLGKSLPQGSAA